LVSGKGEIEMSQHFWILEIYVGEWIAKHTERGGLAIHAYESKSSAAADLYNARQQHGKARLVKYVPDTQETRR
jgi:hypothetical protein